MSLDSIGPILDSAQTSLLLGVSMEPGILIAYNATDGDYDPATASKDAVAVTMARYDSTDDGLPDGHTPVKLITGEGTLELTTDEAAVTAGQLFWQAASGKVSKTPSPGLMFEAVETIASTSGTKRFEARLRSDRIKPVVHTVTAAEGTANEAVIATGFGATVRVLGAPLVNGALESGWTVTEESDGTVTVAATSLSENDVIAFCVAPTAA